MTTATSHRPAANMSTAPRSRFPNMSASGGSAWTQSIWTNHASSSNNPIGPIGKRDLASSRGSDHVLAGRPSGSGALAADSEVDHHPQWPASRNKTWNTTETPPSRTTSGNTSPNRTRDGPQALQDQSPYFPTSRPAIGQSSAGFPNRSKTSGALEQPTTSSFKYTPGFRDMSDDKDNAGPLGSLAAKYDEHVMRGGVLDRRGSQDPAYLISSTPRDLNPSGPNNTETDGHAQPSLLNGYAFTNAAHAHGHRPSLGAPSASYPGQVANRRAFASNAQIEDDLASHFRGLQFDEPADRTGGLTSGGYSTGLSSQAFHFNTAPQPWEHGLTNNAKMFGNGFSQEPYGDTLGNSYMNKRGSIGRSSPAGSVYRPSLNSPKNFGATPPPGMEGWSRPSSRDQRMAPDVDRRNHGQQFPYDPTAAFYAPHFLNHNYNGQFPGHLYDPYGQSNFRSPIQLPPYGLAVAPYLQGAAVSMRSSKDADAGRGFRSVLLDEFRSSSKSNKRYELKDIYGHVVEFSGDQHGSRFIQQKLETANSDEKDQIFKEIEQNAVQLMMDVFGNYVIQKFFEHGNQVQKKVLASQMKGRVTYLSYQMYACRVVQKALEHVLVEQQAELVREIESDVLQVVKDQNGNHVIQKIIECVPRQYIGFIMDSFRGQVSGLASHSYGCRVIQRMLEYGSESDKAVIMDELHNCAQVMITDQYGNYVMQHVIQHGEPEDKSKMIGIVTSQLVTLSKHKFASNVVEKCIEYGTAEERRRIRRELSTIGSDGTSPLQLMMKDQYGNYVIQKLLSQLEGTERQSFIEEIRPQINQLKKVSAGRQVAALDRLILAMATTAPQSKDGSVSSPASQPALQVDVNSAAPTPGLTMETNSPESSNPPSAHTSAIDESIPQTTSKARMNISRDGQEGAEMRLDEAAA